MLEDQQEPEAPTLGKYSDGGLLLAVDDEPLPQEFADYLKAHIHEYDPPPLYLNL